MRLIFSLLTNRKKAFLLFFLFVFLSESYPSEDKYSIRVIDSQTKEPIVNVHFYINNRPLSYSDKQGIFTVDESLFTNPEDSISFSCIGYQNKKIDLAELKKNDFTVMLERESVPIGDAFVYGNRLKRFIRYTTLSSLPVRLHSFASVLYKDTIYAVGGVAAGGWFTGNMYKYSIKSDKWIKSEHTFKRRTGHALHIYNDKMYIIGGMTALPNRKRFLIDNTIEIFNLKTGETISDPINPHVAFNFASVLMDNLVFIMGGSQKILYSGAKTFIKDNHLFNFKTGFWYKFGELEEGKEVKGILVNGKIYLIGGYTFQDLDVIECYDPETGKTTTEAKMPLSIARPALATNGHLIYIFNKGRIYIYNTVSKELDEYLVDIELEEAELHYHDRKLYLLGGKEIFMEKAKIAGVDMELETSEGSPYIFCIDTDEFDSTKRTTFVVKNVNMYD